MKRNALSILAGAGLWAALWCASRFPAAAMFPNAFGADGSVFDFAPLTFFLIWSVVLSLLAGAVTSRIARGAPLPVRLLAGVQLSIGLAVELSGWSLAPAWYHVAFLVLLVPTILMGGQLGRPRTTL